MEEGLLDLNIPMCYFRQYDAAQAADYVTWCNFIRDHQYSRQAVIGPGAFLECHTRHDLPKCGSRRHFASGQLGPGVCVNGLKQTNKDGLPRTDFLNALVSASAYDPLTPPIFAQQASVPAMPWKSAPTKGHLKGFLYGGGTTNPLDGAAFVLRRPGPPQRPE